MKIINNKQSIISYLAHPLRSILHGRSIELFLVPASAPCNKGCGMCYSVCGIMHIKEPLLVIKKRSPSGGSRFPLSLSD